jgi:hypothetical protein
MALLFVGVVHQGRCWAGHRRDQKRHRTGDAVIQVTSSETETREIRTDNNTRYMKWISASHGTSCVWIDTVVVGSNARPSIAVELATGRLPLRECQSLTLGLEALDVVDEVEPAAGAVVPGPNGALSPPRTYNPPVDWPLDDFAFERPRFHRLYRQWMKEGDGALHGISSTMIRDAVSWTGSIVSAIRVAVP